MAGKRPGGHCRNRDIVNVDNEYFSDAYDFEGDSGGAWWEYIGLSPSNSAMCGSGVWRCTSDDIERWRTATDRYITKEFRPQLAKTKKVIGTYSGGAGPSLEQQETLNAGDKLLKDWKEFQKREVPSPWWANEFLARVKSIVQYFDRAACLMDDLNDIADEAGASHIANRAPVLLPKKAPDGGPWIRDGAVADTGAPSSKGLGMVGWVALGAAGYFGFKVLTE